MAGREILESVIMSMSLRIRRRRQKERVIHGKEREQQQQQQHGYRRKQGFPLNERWGKGFTHFIHTSQEGGAGGSTLHTYNNTYGRIREREKEIVLRSINNSDDEVELEGREGATVEKLWKLPNQPYLI